MKSNTPNIKVIHWNPRRRSKVLDNFMARSSIPEEALRVAQKVLRDIQKEGDEAIVRYAKRFDGVSLTPQIFTVREKGVKVDTPFMKAAQLARKNVTRFAKAGLRPDWHIKTNHGGKLGEKFLPLDRVGVYVPSGTAPLVSTAFMTITLAKVAGVPEIAAFTVSQPDGRIDPHLLYSMIYAGATEIYRIGGIPAIGAMAYGTRTIPKVQKIVGPGNAYVTAAKKLVFGDVDIDMLAGPSEVAILADAQASPAYIAADLMAQAEHGSGLEKALLVTDSAKLISNVLQQIKIQLKALSRAKMIGEVLNKGTLFVKSPDLETGIDLINRFAPEHFEILTKNPARWSKKARTSGAIFLGPWTPECAGDFIAGPSHVLPTGGTAATFSGLTVDDFRRRTSILSLKKEDLKEGLPAIEAFGRVEKLDAHSASGRIRFSK